MGTQPDRPDQPTTICQHYDSAIVATITWTGKLWQYRPLLCLDLGSLKVSKRRQIATVIAN